MVNNALWVLQMERGKEEIGGRDYNYDNEDEGDRDRDCKVGQPLDCELDNVMNVLVHNMTEEFGFAPCDTYRGIFHPSHLKM